MAIAVEQGDAGATELAEEVVEDVAHIESVLIKQHTSQRAAPGRRLPDDDGVLQRAAVAAADAARAQ